MAGETDGETTCATAYDRNRGGRLSRLFRRSDARAPAPHGVNVVGYLDATSGLGERARELVATLRAGGLAVSEWPVAAHGDEPTSPATSGVVYDTTIAVVTAVQLADVVQRVPDPFERPELTVGYFFWELAEVPEEQHWGIGLVDEIWAPTRFVADAYRAATDTVVRDVPLPLPHRSHPVGPPAHRRSDHHDRLDVLVAFDFLSVMERKNPIGAIEAFRRAFPESEPVHLLVKTLNGDQRPEQLERVRMAIRGDDRIELRDERCSREALTELTASSDVLLSLHRSEGLGLHLAEAMALGTVVVASRYGGNLDLMDDDCAALVDVELVEVRDGEGAYAAPARWADPHLDQAARLLRRTLDEPEWRHGLARRAAERVAESPSREEIGANLARILS
jgi:glycosyltransferase involved in cell wall biosynthesis